MRKLTAILAASAFAVSATSAVAQNSGLVVVDLSNADVLNNLAQNLKVNVSDIQALNNVSVAVPVGVAANVCGVDANILAAQKKTGDAKCTAQNSSKALQQAVAKALAGNKKQ